MFANRGVNNDQSVHPGTCKEGSTVSIEYQGKDVVCKCDDKEYRRWKGQAQWPARAGISIYDPKPFALDSLKLWGFADAKPVVDKSKCTIPKPPCEKKADYGTPVFKYKNSYVENSDGSVSKTTGQGWNKAGAYTDATCKSGNCKFTAKIHKQANTGVHFARCRLTCLAPPPCLICILSMLSSFLFLLLCLCLRRWPQSALLHPPVIDPGSRRRTS